MTTGTPVASPAAKDTTKGGPLVAQLVEGVQADLEGVVAELRAVRERVTMIEAYGRGLNGLGSTMRAQATRLDEAIKALTEESASVAKKLLGTGREPITERTDSEHLERVKAAREAAHV